MNDTLNNWEKWPIGALFFAQGLQIAEWYISKRMPAEVIGILPWFVTIGGIAAMAAIDGAMIAAIMGARAGRRGNWTWAAIGITALFGGLVALDLNGAILGIGPWLHAGFATTIAVYLMHLVQPRQDVISALAAREEEIDRRTAELERAVEQFRRQSEVITLEEEQPPSLPLAPAHQLSSRTYRRLDPRGYVYVLRTEQGTHKIGMAVDVELRVKEIRAFVPFAVELVLTIATDNRRLLEKRLHTCFADRRLRGEWFALTDDDLDALHSIGEHLQSDEIDDTIDTLSMLVNLPTTIEMDVKDDVPEIIRLKDADKLTFTQIGDRLGITRQAAWQQYKAAKKD